MQTPGIVEGLGITCVIIGISGIAGAMEHGAGLIQSVMLLVAGALMLHVAYRTGSRRGKGKERC